MGCCRRLALIPTMFSGRRCWACPVTGRASMRGWVAREVFLGVNSRPHGHQQRLRWFKAGRSRLGCRVAGVPFLLHPRWPPSLGHPSDRLKTGAPGRWPSLRRRRSACVKAASRRRAVPGVALGRHLAVRLLVLRRNCQLGCGECPAGALRPPRRGARQPTRARRTLRRAAALCAPLKSVERKFSRGNGPVGRFTSRRLIYPALNRHDAERRADLGAYWAL